MPLATNPLIQVTPGLMIWTVVCFLITLWVLKRYAFGPIQKTIDERRQRIEQSIHEAEEARNEARRLLEEHRALIGQARGTLDQSQRNDILHQAQQIEYNKGGYIIPYFSNQIDAYSAKMAGFVEAKSGFPLGNYWFKNVGFTA